MRRFLTFKVITILLVAVVLGFLDLPTHIQEKIYPNLPEKVRNIKYNLGLDLQGGTQLTYKIDLSNVEQSQQDNIVNGVIEVISKRVNSLGVNEPNIYISDFGGEKYIVVELAGIKDIEEAKATVGKVIQLEFKKQKTTEDPLEVEKIKTQANDSLAKIKAGSDFTATGNELKELNQGKVAYTESADFQYKDEFVPAIQGVIDSLPLGGVYNEIIEGSAGYTVDESGLKEKKGIFLLMLTEKQMQEREIKHDKEVNTSHILLNYEGAERAPEQQTRTKEEAETIAKEVIEKLNNGEKFEDLAKQYSDDSSKDKGGVLEAVVTTNSEYDPDFIAGALALENVNEYSKTPVETKFGFHIIKANDIKAEYTESKQEQAYKLKQIFFSTLTDPWENTELNGQYFESATVQFNSLYQPLVSITFNDEGAKMFEKLTEENIGKPIAIFVGGELISAPNVQQKISGGQAQISGNFTVEEANNLARDLMTGAIPAPITLSGQYSLGASIGSEALHTSLIAGMIGIIALGVFMLFLYRLPGLIAIVALIVYSILLAFLIKIELPIMLATLISAAIFVFVVVKIIQSSEDGLEKLVSFMIATFGFFFMTFLLGSPITITLAGLAGIVLSIGMAVDANILIFERMKEELRAGESYATAIVSGFNRAWPSIRDSNFTTLITCAILMMFGSSVIKGFAFNLAAGVMVSMFTAISISYVFLQLLKYTKIENKLFLLGSNLTPETFKKPSIHVMKYRKIFYTISIASIVPGIIAIAIYGFNYGLDFKGGTLIEMTFPNAVTSEQITTAIKQVDESYNASQTDENKKIDLAVNPQIVSTGENTYMLRLKSIEEDVHQQLLQVFKQNFGEIKEDRFTTIGPTVGASLKNKSMVSLSLALLCIMGYIIFAFRKVPRQVKAWQFGLAAVIALAHDLVTLAGIYTIIGIFVPGAEFDTLFVTALLTTAGFSIHDTIVVFDRLRENLNTHKTSTNLEGLTDNAINETFHRSINTSLSTLIPLIAMFFFGSESIKYFVLALIIGISVGAYSSIFIASPLLIDLQKKMK